MEKKVRKNIFAWLVALLIMIPFFSLTAKAEGSQLAILSQPQDQTWVEGSEASFSVEAAGEGLTYQWQVRFSNDTDFKNALAPSAKSANYHFTMQRGHKGLEVRCIVTEKHGESLISDFATIHELRIVSQPKNIIWMRSSEAFFSVGVFGEGLTYQWQVRFAGKEEFKNALAPSAKTANYHFEMQNGHKGMEVRCIITDKNGISVTSDVAGCASILFFRQPVNHVWEAGKEASFFVDAEGENLSFQWQVKFAGKKEFQNALAPSAKTKNYHFTMQQGHKGMLVRCIVTDKHGISIASGEVMIYELESGLNQVVFSGNKDERMITNKYGYYEGEKFILFLDKGVNLPGDFANNIAHIMDKLEEKSKLSFFAAYEQRHYNNTYNKFGFDPWEGIEFGKKVPIYVFMGREYVSSANDAYMSLCYDESGFDYYIVVHELTHTLTFRNSKNSKIIAEGTADYYAESVLDELKYLSNEIKMNYENLLDIYRFEENTFYEQYKDLVTPDGAESFFLDDFSSLSMTDRESEYIFGRILCNFLSEMYGEDFLLDFFTAVNASEIDIYYNNHTAEDMKEYANIFKSVFGADVFRQFGTWYQENAGRIH